jgi:uncharacterized protein YeaO (DUF488 family)
MTLGVAHEIKVNKSVRDPVDKKEDGFRVLITRYWPRGISKKHIAAESYLSESGPKPELLTRKQVAAKRSFKDLDPSVQLYKDWKNMKENGMTWSDYTRRFLEEIQNNPQAQLCIEWLRKKSKNIDITLLCIEKEGNPYCHRYIVKALIEGKVYTPPTL